LNFVEGVIQKLDNSINKQFLHKDIWPWNLIEAEDGMYLLDFNDWSIGNPIIELSVALLEFSMFKSDKFNTEIAQSICNGYRSIKPLNYEFRDLWETMIFICYLYFPYNVIQAEDRFESEIYLKRIETLLQNSDLLKVLQ
jgi:Ser/Thr protein kinase RdoA (MazF antagonist)